METPDEAGDRIQIEELELQVRIGVSDDEQKTPQRLTISITIWPEISFSDLDDQLERTVDYADVVCATKELAASRPCRLIETLAERIAQHLLQNFRLRKVQLELRKFILPDVKYAAVILMRERSRGG